MIEHQAEQQRFVLNKDGHECVLEYLVTGSDIDFTRTYVPFALRGQGLAEELVKAGLAWADQQQYHKQASCWYVQRYLEAP